MRRKQSAARDCRRFWFFPVGCVLILWASPAAARDSGASVSRAKTPPNILLLVAEDMSARVGAFGDRVARTPNIDRLAAQGVRFPNTFTTAGVCAPSRAAFILGMHQISTGTQHMRTESGPNGRYLSVPPPEAKAFPELLRRANYFTFQHGKLDYQFSGALSGTGPSTIWDAEDNDSMWADRAPDQPFFGMINYLVTHESGMFAPLGTWPSSLFHFIMQIAQAYTRWGWTEGIVPTDPALVSVPPYYPDVPEVRHDLAVHYDNIQIMDAQVGAVLERLERDGLAESTIVIWTTDHGDGLPRAKRDLFDAGIKVPMIIRWPDAMRPESLSPGEIDERLISFIDLSVTILAFAGIERPESMQGHDFLDPAHPPRQYVFASRDRIDDTTDRQRALRDDRFKYIRSDLPNQPGGHHTAFRDTLRIMQALWRELEAGRMNAAQRSWFEAPGAERLFDLELDPFELSDVSDAPAYQETLERMRGAYAAWRERVPDWGDQPEDVMAEEFWPGGEQPATAPVTFSVEAEKVVLRSKSRGASITMSIDEGPWRLYREPLAVGAGSDISARAVRYGWQESDETRWTREPSNVMR